MSQDYKKHTASLLLKDNFISNGSLFMHNQTMYFLTTGHSVYGRKFNLTHDVNDLQVRNELGDNFEVEEISSSQEYSKKHEIGLIKLKSKDVDLNEYAGMIFSTTPTNDSVDFILRGNQKTSQKKYTYRDELKFSEIDMVDDNRFDVKIRTELLTDNIGSRGADWMGGFSGSMLFSDKTDKFYSLGLLIEIPNNGDNGQIKFVSLVPLNQILHDIEIIDYEQIKKQFKKKKYFEKKDFDKFKLDENYEFNNEYHLKREVESKSDDNDTYEPMLSFFNPKQSESIINEFQKQNLIFLIGNPGMGKTEELKKVAFDVLNDSIYLSKYFKVNNFTKQDSISDFLNYTIFKEYDEVLFVLDGIDEIANPKDFLSKLDDFITKLKDSERKHKFLVSCRTNIYNSKSLYSSNEHKVLVLKGLDIYSAKELFCLLVGGDVELNSDENKKIDSLKEFLSNPTKVKLLAQFYKDNSRIETNQVQIWGGYIDSVLGNDKTEKKKKINILVPRIKYNATKLALLNELRHTMLIDEDNLYELILEGNSYEELIESSLINSNLNSNVFFFEDKEVQEFLVARYLSKQTYMFIVNLLAIEGTDIIRPTLLNVFSFLLNIIPNESTLFERLIVWGEENNPTSLIYIETDRVPQLRISLFQKVFTKYHVNKTIWKTPIGSDKDFANFGNVEENFKFLIDIIVDEKLNERTIAVAINLMTNFSVYDKINTKKVLDGLLKKESFSINLKSKVIRLLELYVDDKDIELIIKLFNTEPDKSINSAILFLIKNQVSLDKYFDYIKKEFLWANNIIPRNQIDDVIYGNEWVLNSYLLRFEDEDNFLNLASYYLVDFRLSTEKNFGERLIKRFQYFQDKNPNFFNKIIKKIDFDTNNRNRHNEEIFILIIKQLNKELEVFKLLLSAKTFSESKWFLARISSKESIDHLLLQKNIITNKNGQDLQGFRNIISSYNNRELAKYLEKGLVKNKIVINEIILVGKKLKAFTKKEQNKVQNNFNTLFNDSGLILKVNEMITDNSIQIITNEEVRAIANDFYDNKNNHFKELNIGYDALNSIAFLYNSIKKEGVEDLLTNQKALHLITLKTLLESNKNNNYKFVISKNQSQTVGKWINKVAKAIDFNDLLIFKDFNTFSYKNNEAFKQYKILKVLYYFFNNKEYQQYFSDDFRLASLNYYEIDQFDENSDNYKSLISSIENKELISKQIIENLNHGFFSSNGKKQMIYALENRIDVLYKVIRSYLNDSQQLPSSSLFKLYIEKTNDLDLLVELINDRSNLIAWDAMEILIELSHENHSKCIDYSIKYLDSGYNDFKSQAIGILFKLNNEKALKYFSLLLGRLSLEDVPQKLFSNYSVKIDTLLEEFDSLFNKIYDVKYSQDNFSWEFSMNNDFFIKLLLNGLFKTSDKLSYKTKIEDKFDDIINKLDIKTLDYDRKFFFSNTIKEEIERNYINIISKPLNFQEALIEVNKVFK